MNITIINDCRDESTKGRQLTRISSLIEGPVSFVGVSSDLEAAGNLVDVLDAYAGTPGLVLVNVAPRNGKAKQWKNETPFGYFWHKETLVVSSVDGLTLSLVKKLGITDSIQVMDIPTVVRQLVTEEALTSSIADQIISTQFRSYEFLPRIGVYLLRHKKVVSEKLDIQSIPDAPAAVWWVDNFGNCKTTLLESQEVQESSLVKIPCFERLKDVPDTTRAFIIGSSGFGDTRVREIVVQGGNASLELELSSGQKI